jgi:phosphoadenosine phosphosulfate reductase
MNIDDQGNLTGHSVKEKIAYSKNIVEEALEKYSSKNIRIAWTGGKDSTVMLWLFKEVCNAKNVSMPEVMFIDEGNVFEEIWKLVKRVKKEWNLSVDIVKNTNVSDKASRIGDVIYMADLNKRNRQEIEKLGIKDRKFEFEPESFIGNHLMKTVAMNIYLESNNVRALATAIRWDEQEARLGEEFFSPRKNPDHYRVHPILHLKERDVWDIIHEFDIPFCSLYYQGYRSLGAKGSTIKSADIPAWEQDLENTSERSGRGKDKENVMEQLRSLGYM